MQKIFFYDSFVEEFLLQDMELTKNFKIMKKIVVWAGALVLTAAVSVVIAVHRPISPERALLLKNVAALAESEKPSESKECYNTIGGSLGSGMPLLPATVYCHTCTEVPCQFRDSKSYCPMD